MLENIIKNKVKVFISSNCSDEKYKVMRRALKELLINTGFVDVYIFEDEPASSSYVEDSYIQELDNSDLCIFIIDNEEREGILKEYRRAKNLNKRSIYFFINGKNNKKTMIQKEIELNGKERYREINDFSTIIHEAFKATIQDIINIYKFKNYTSKNIKVDEVQGKEKVIIYKLKKVNDEILKLMTNELLNDIQPIKQQEDINEFAFLCIDLLKVVLKKKKIDNNNYENLKTQILKMYDGNIMELVKERLDILKLYYNGEIEECIVKLKKILLKQEENIPKWILNDIAIDLRNLENLYNDTINKVCFKTEGQKYIDNCKETVYYPLIDKIDENRSQEILNMFLNKKLDSPYTSRIETLKNIFDYISSCFYIALINGSITQLNLTLYRMEETLLSLSIMDSQHYIFVQTIKFLILTQNKANIEKIIRIYKNEEVLNSKDIGEIYSYIQNIQIEYLRVISECILLKYFNLYFSDKQYIKIFNKVCNDILVWIRDDNKIIKCGYYYFDMLLENIYRGDNEKICNIALEVIDLKLNSFYNEALKILSNINYKNISIDTQKNIMIHLIDIMESNDNSKIMELEYSVIVFRKNATILDKNKFDLIVEKNMSPQFVEIYNVQLEDKDIIYKEDYIDKCVDNIHNDNINQGKDGVYSLNSNNDYKNISCIMDTYNIKLNASKLSKLLNTLMETLISKNQIISAKNDAIQLMIYLKKKNNIEKVFNKYSIEITNNFEEIVYAKTNSIFENESVNLVKVNIKLMFAIFIPQAMIEVNFIIEAMKLNNYEKIKALKYMYEFLKGIKYDKINDDIVKQILQYASIMSDEEEQDIRFWAVNCLLQLTYSQYKNIVLEQLSNIMDSCSDKIKIAIISRLKESSIDKENEFVKFIIEKGKIDNNYLVRRLIEDYRKEDVNNENKK